MEKVDKEQVILAVCSAFSWYYANYGYRSGADILWDNIIKSINALDDKMSANEFIKLHLQNCRYGEVLTKEAEEIAKENGLAVVFGASNNLCEFRGAVDDKAFCCYGGDIYINSEGVIANNDDEFFDDFDPYDFPEFKLISAIWRENGRECSWSYKTDIPHEEFVILDDDNTYYCFGIVFRLKDVNVKKYIDARELLNNAYRGREYESVVSADFIRSRPAADVVSVVRCGNCKYKIDLSEGGCWCEMNDGLENMRDDFFCADGEKKGET